jgi:hypothetical protein
MILMATTKVSLTIENSDLSWLRKRAKHLHGGNLSAAFAEAARVLRKQEALRTFLDAEGVAPLEPEELGAIQEEWLVGAHPRKRRLP